jgi:hypothetical protein
MVAEKHALTAFGQTVVELEYETIQLQKGEDALRENGR